MTGTTVSGPVKNPVARIFKVLKLDRREISSVYFYAVLNGLIQLTLPLGIQSIISFVLGGSISTSLVILIIVVVLGVFVNGLVQVNQMKLIEKVQQKVFVRYSFEYANRIPRLNLISVDSYYLPELVNRFFDTVSLQKGISKLLLEIPTATIQILFGLMLLSFYHPVFILFSFLLILLVYLILYYSGARGLETSFNESAFKYKVAAWLQELARMVKSFKFSKGTRLNLKRTDTLVNGYLAARTTHFRILLLQYWTLIGFKVLITAAMLIVGSILLIDQQLNLGQFIAAEIVILLVLNSVEKLIMNLDKVYDVLTSVEKLSKVTDKPTDPDGETELMRRSEGMHLKLDRLRFAYDDKTVLEDISLEAKPGSKIMVMGADGSGKSSLIRVLSGVYQNFEGGFLIDGVPLRNYSAESLRYQTGILLSHQEIFTGTLLENITMGDPAISTADIMNLAGKIGLTDFLQEQDAGFATRLDPAGKRLSRTVIHKILLLRALINKPRLLLLEEPLRGADETFHDKTIEYLIHGSEGATVIVESNDETIAEKFDEVIWMEGGRIRFKGPWKQVKNEK
jgi:ABC-type bacteriocin/lantibiotic exporter with double-glycine peptidase domain